MFLMVAKRAGLFKQVQQPCNITDYLRAGNSFHCTDYNKPLEYQYFKYKVILLQF